MNLFSRLQARWTTSAMLPRTTTPDQLDPTDPDARFPKFMCAALVGFSHSLTTFTQSYNPKPSSVKTLVTILGATSKRYYRISQR